MPLTLREQTREAAHEALRLLDQWTDATDEQRRSSLSMQLKAAALRLRKLRLKAAYEFADEPDTEPRKRAP